MEYHFFGQNRTQYWQRSVIASGGGGTVYFGQNGTQYRQGAVIASGGEGTVYEIANNRRNVMKLYHGHNGNQLSSAELNEKRDKIQAMLNMLNSGFNPYLGVTDHGRPTGRTILSVAWPVDLLKDSYGQFHGFVMPKVEGRQSLVVACSEEERAKLLFTNSYTWRSSIFTACNLAVMVKYLHEYGIIIGDMNANNIMVQGESLVTLIDADSFTVTDRNGRVFPCIVGLPETEPPEIQGRDMSTGRYRFDEYTDRFALAIHIWNLLCNNYHPFNVPKSITGNSSVSGSSSTQVHNITNGYCPYMYGEPRNWARGAPNPAMLPNDIMDLFRRVFVYTAATGARPDTRRNRPSAAEWVKALMNLCYHTSMATCRSNSSHMYRASYGRCPWCEAEMDSILRQISGMY